jgi:PPOX class probable F420-dependent enzyme
VSIAVDGLRTSVRTCDAAEKVRRLRNDPAVTIAPCTTRGRVTGPAIAAHAMLLDGAEASTAARVRWPASTPCSRASPCPWCIV